MIDVSDFYKALIERGLDFFTGVPDSLLKSFCAYVSEHSCQERHVIAANEGSAIGIACGWFLSTGKAPVVYMQNSGEGNAVNPLLSIAHPRVYSIPMLMVIGWRGEPGVPDEPQHAMQGEITCDLLKTMDIPYVILEDDWRGQLSNLCKIMNSQSRPVALVVKAGTFNCYAGQREDSVASMTREEMLESFVDEMTNDDFVITTTGKTSRELYEIRERRGQRHSNDFLVIGGMGHASSIACGVALGSNADVWCIDGDGSLIMHMGALAVVSNHASGNFKYILNRNGTHESVGGQRNVANDIDVVSILHAFGFELVLEASTPDELLDSINEMKGRKKAALVVNTRQGSRPNLGRPTESPLETKRAFMEQIAPYQLGV